MSREAVKNTCRQCRERKAQCSRGAPCDTCVRRGIGHLCDWEGAVPTHEGFSGGRQALQHNRDKNDAEAVTSRVQRVLDLLESAEDEDRSSGYRMLRHIQSVPLENADNDLATQLSTLSLEQAVPQHRQAVCIDGITPIKEQLVTEVGLSSLLPPCCTDAASFEGLGPHRARHSKRHVEPAAGHTRHWSRSSDCRRAPGDDPDEGASVHSVQVSVVSSLVIGPR